MKLAILTPLPPTRSGIAHYSSMLLPALAKHAEVRAFESLDEYDRRDYDEVIYQLGNNPFHEQAFVAAMREPGIAVLHDLVLHHLIVEMTLARGDVDGFIAALRANHGEAGEAWARARARRKASRTTSARFAEVRNPKNPMTRSLSLSPR